MNFFVTDKKFHTDIVLQYLESEKDAERLDNGDWKLYVDEPWQLYKEDTCKDMEQAIQKFLFNYGKADHLDLKILIEYCYDDKVIGFDEINCLPSVNSVSEQLAETKYNYHTREISDIKKAYAKFEKLFLLTQEQQVEVLKFAEKCCVEKQKEGVA